MGKPREWEALQILEAIGRQLDADDVVNVRDGGFVVPSTAAASSLNSGKEMWNGSAKGAGRPATGPRQRTPGWQGPSGGSRPAGTAAPLVGESVRRQYEIELNDLAQHYPGTQLWRQELGVWLLSPSQLIGGLGRSALILSGLSYAWPTVRSWAFWAHAFAKPKWIGPRHTNFNDGSICSFEVTDRTWLYGQPIVGLIDLHTVWVMRHLHLELFGRWPGRQVAHFGIERLIELTDNDLCGCGASIRYADCCKPRDQAQTRVSDAVEYALRPRVPPQAVVDIVNGAAPPPDVTQFV